MRQDGLDGMKLFHLATPPPVAHHRQESIVPQTSRSQQPRINSIKIASSFFSYNRRFVHLRPTATCLLNVSPPQIRRHYPYEHPFFASDSPIFPFTSLCINCWETWQGVIDRSIYASVTYSRAHVRCVSTLQQ